MVESKQIPALQLEHFQNLIREHWILKRKRNKTRPNPTLWFVMESAQQPQLSPKCHWTNLKKNPSFYFYLMVKLVALVFYEKKMIFLTFIHRSKNTLTAVNLQKLEEMRSYWFVSYFGQRINCCILQ